VLLFHYEQPGDNNEPESNLLDASECNGALADILVKSLSQEYGNHTFIKNDKSQLIHCNEAMRKCIEKYPMCRENDPNVVKYRVPRALIRPVLQAVFTGKRLNSIAW
jgi:hypothetical protein